MALYYCAWLYPSGENEGPKYFIYLTHWAQLAWVMYLLVAAVAATYKFFQVNFCCKANNSEIIQDDVIIDTPIGCCGNDSDGIAWYHKLQWLLFSIGAEIALAVSILYWTVIYDGSEVDGVNLNVHLTNGVIAVVDLWFSATPVRLLHIIYPLIFGAFYLIFTGIYHAADGTNSDDEPYVYSVIDYGESPGSAVGVALAIELLFLPFIHVVFYIQYVIRFWITFKIYHGRRHPNLEPENGQA